MMIYQEDPTASIYLLRDRLLEMGYSCKEYALGHQNLFEFEKNGKKWLTPGHKMLYPFNSTIVKLISKEKSIAYDFAAREGINIPRTVIITSIDGIDTAKTLMHDMKEIIVKPLDSSLALGVTLGIKSDDALDKAIIHAREFSSIVLAQEQVRGDEIRFAIVGGKVVAALLRESPRVVGDGSSTIAELVRKENSERAALDKHLFEYPQLDETLIDGSFMTSEIIPKQGEIIEFNTTAMVRYGASMVNVIDDLHEGYIIKAEQAGKALSDDFIVVDMMIADYRKPCEDNNYWFIEYNTTPVLKLFHNVRRGESVDVVGMVADRIDRTVQSVISYPND